MLHDICNALDSHPTLAETLCGQLGWQAWFLTLWSDHYQTPTAAMGKEIFVEFLFFHKHSFQLKLVSDCVAATLRFGMSQPDGWMILEVFIFVLFVVYLN